MSPSGSVELGVAVSVWSVVGVVVERTMPLMLGAVFCTVAAAEVSGAPASEPSSGVTVTVIASFLSPLPGWERSRLAPVAPAMSLPFLCHW